MPSTGTWDDAWRVGARDLVRRVGTVFQDPEHQFVRGRVDDELAVGPLRAGSDVDSTRTRVAELLARLRLAPLAAANPFTLSGGEKRRLSVGTALATDPPLLVLDEPTFGQDRVTYAELVRLLRDARGAQARHSLRDPRPRARQRSGRPRSERWSGPSGVMLLTPLRADPRAPLARANPLAKLGAAAIVMLVLFLSVDPVTPALILVAIACAVPLSGISAGALLRRTWPVFIAAIGASAVNGLFGSDGPSLMAGVATGLRLIAIALAGVVAFITIDPTDLADSLMQYLHASPRFAVGALAAFRLLPIFAAEWETIGLARRARGIDDGGSWLARIASFRERSFTLLVAAIRRGVRLALAMDARGFADMTCRSIARPQHFTGLDQMLLAAALATAAGTVALGMALGTWRGLIR